MQTAALAAAQLSGPIPINIEAGSCEWLNSAWYTHAPSWRTAAELQLEFPAVDATYDPVFSAATNVERFPETRAQLAERALATVKAVVARYGGEGNLAFFGHGTSIDALFKAVVPKERRGVGKIIPFCALTVCVPQADGSYAAEVVADTAHLPAPEDLSKSRYV